MIIKSKFQAADQGTHGPILLAAWEAGETSVTVGGVEYEFVREVEMYTGEKLAVITEREISRMPYPAQWNMLGRLRDLILARRVEMLRAMGDEGLEREVRTVMRDNWGKSETCTTDIIALVREHIEANRPVLTGVLIGEWEDEWHGLSANESGTLLSFIAHRAAEYRSPVVAELRAEIALLKEEWSPRERDLVYERQELRNHVAELRAENERLTFEVTMARGPSKPIWDNVKGEQCTACAGTGLTIPLPQDVIAQLSSQQERINLANLELPSNLDIANEVQVYVPTTSAAQTFFAYGAGYVKSVAVRIIAALRAENERLKKELADLKDAFRLMQGAADLHLEDVRVLRVKLADSEKEVGALRIMIADENLKLLQNTLASPQPVDDTDYWGIAMTGESASLVHRNHNGWELKQCVHGSWLDEEKPITLDPARIFKVTSQPRGPLNVPSEEDITEKAVSESSIVERNRWFGEGALWAIEWIKEENGGE